MAKTNITRREGESKAEYRRRYCREWYAAHPRKGEAQRRWNEKNPDKIREAGERFDTNNRERRREITNAYHARKPWVSNSNCARWRAERLRATPAWADLKAIREIYREAARRSKEDGVKYHVDHHYPLKGDNVCGLHVEGNLKIIPASENARKRNRHPDELL